MSTDQTPRTGGTKARRLLVGAAIGLCVGFFPLLRAYARPFFFDGNALLAMCEMAPQTQVKAICFGYVAGVHDVMRNEKPINGFSACFPPGATGNQLVDVVVKYLKDNPGIRHYSADGLVESAFDLAFRCKS